MLCISQATLKNWVKLGKIAASTDGKHFINSDVLALIRDIESGKSGALQSRRNKKKIKGNIICEGYINSKENTEALKTAAGKIESPLKEDELRIVIADAALRLFLQKLSREYSGTDCVYDFLNGNITLGTLNPLIYDLISDADVRCTQLRIENIKYVPFEDTLGFIYNSLRSISQRKNSGAYYTPQKTVESSVKLLEEQTDISAKRIIDPCCGTGSFLIHLSRFTDVHNLYGVDIDEISIAAARINIALSQDIENIDFLYKNFICADVLKNKIAKKFDIVIGNPPWGGKAERTETGIADTADIFCETGILMLKSGGILDFVVPESLINVDRHRKLRIKLAEKTTFIFISFLGNAFDSVQCPCVILGIKNSKNNSERCKVIDKDREYYISAERNIDARCPSFKMNDEEYALTEKMEKLFNRCTAKGHSQFALGIVTGGNQRILSDVKSDGYEAVVRGKDILKYKMLPTQKYINYDREKMQQCAPDDIYRAPEKLFYRFIAPVPVVVYDNEGILSLNSCNIFIPLMEGLDMKYIAAVLNSRTAAFYISRKYHSAKILRRYIEDFPFPYADIKTQKIIIDCADSLSCKFDKSVYEKIENIIFGLYGFSDSERALIIADTEKYNYLLYK
jgi:type I restriction-modification system DNA methylase subunit